MRKGQPYLKAYIISTCYGVAIHSDFLNQCVSTESLLKSRSQWQSGEILKICAFCQGHIGVDGGRRISQD